MIIHDKDYRILVVDLDGTVSDDRHRTHLAEAAASVKVSRETQDKVDEMWNVYHSLLVNDSPHEDIMMLINAMHVRGHSIIFSTARNEKWRNHTIEWLRRHCGFSAIHCALLMRPNGDHNRSSELKPKMVIEHLDRFYKGGYPEVRECLTVIDNSWLVLREWEMQKVETIYINRVGGRECS
jgi:hypothetical protein